MRNTGSGTRKTTRIAAATRQALIVTRNGFMSGNLPRFFTFLINRYIGQPIIDPSATANSSLITSSLYGFKNVAMNFRIMNVTTQRYT